MRIVSTLLGCFTVFLAYSGIQTCSGAEEWQSLFNGKDLTGWHAVGDGKWTVEDGAIVGRADNEKLYGLLFSDEQYQDFLRDCPVPVLYGTGPSLKYCV